jgi:outer membrane protein OmpA-like peptidoglycan-associated protein
MKRFAAILCLAALLAAGCSQPMNRTQKGGLLGASAGAAAGALIGQAAGHDTKATLLGAGIGAAVGAGVGAGIGNYMDRQEQAMRDALAAVEGVNINREGNILFVTFRSDNQFGVGSFSPRPSAQQDVARMADILAQYDKTNVLAAGYTDSSGSEETNQTLSERRAGSVKNIMVAQGVAAERVTTIGFGESQPVADNSTAHGRQLNRRVAIKISPK